MKKRSRYHLVKRLGGIFILKMRRIYGQRRNRGADCLEQPVRNGVLFNYGEPLMASIKIDGEGMYELQSVKSNFITSMYGKGGIEEFINNAVKKDAILYIENKKSQNLFSLAKVQFPRSLNKYDFDTIIRKTKSVVKSNTVNKNKSKENLSTDKMFSLRNVDETDLYQATYELIEENNELQKQNELS